MLNTRDFGLKHGLRVVFVLSAVVAAPVVDSTASAGVHVDIGFNFTLPQGVHVSAVNVQPYYVGRVFYEPAGVWRPVYSFPVETAFGIVYQPYVYDGGQAVCRGYIPGPGGGYTSIVIDGHGHFDPGWYHGPNHGAGHAHAEHRDHGWDHHDRGSHHDGGHR